MRFRSVSIESMAYVIPPERVTSADIEARLAPLYERLRLPEGRLELMTGIRARHFWPQPIRPSEASAEAGTKALAASAFDAGDIDLLVHCGVCRDRLEPATAAYVHGLLGLGPAVQIADVSNACLGFLNGLVLAGGLIESGQIRRALLVSGEDGRPLLEHTIRSLLEGEHTRKSVKPYFANLTIGAGAVAAVLCHRDEIARGRDSLALLGGTGRTDSAANKLCEGDSAGTGGLAMLTEAEALLDAGIALAGSTWNDFLPALGWTAATPSRVVCHQVGRAHQRRLLEALGIDPAKDFITYPEMGNVGSVSLPLTLARAVEENALAPGQTAALLGIGSGLSCLMLGVERQVAR